MSEFNSLYIARSTNGRWGCAIVSKGESSMLSPKHVPMEGKVSSLGKVSGIDTFVFTPEEGCGQWVLVLESEVEIVGGASFILENMDMQSGSYVSILLLSDEAVVKVSGYKKRSKWVRAFINGEPTQLSAPILLAMGLVPPDAPPVVEELPPPPKVEGAIAAAFAALRNK